MILLYEGVICADRRYHGFFTTDTKPRILQRPRTLLRPVISVISAISALGKVCRCFVVIVLSKIGLNAGL